MKVLFVLVLVCITSSIFAQSKKDQIAALTLQLDSLSREYVKDTAQLNHTVESLERKNSVLSGQHKAAQEQNKKKSQAIRDKTETIKTLNASNLELMEERKELNQTILILKSEMKVFKDSLGKDMYLFSLSNGARDMYMGEGQKLPVEVDIGLYINERFYIIETFDDVAWIKEDEQEQIYRFKKGQKEGMGIGFDPDHLGWQSLGLVLIENMPYIIDNDGGGDRENIRLRKIEFDIYQNLSLKVIFEAERDMAGDGITCISGDCEYKNYLSNRYPDE